MDNSNPIQRSGIWKQIALWTLLYIFWTLVLQNRTLTLSRTLTVEFCYLLFIAGNYYLHIYYTIPALLYRKRYAAFLAVLLGGIGAGALLRSLLAQFMNHRVFNPHGIQPPFSTIFLSSLLNIGCWVILLLAAWLMLEKIRFRRYIDAIEKEKTKNELDFLKAQFNPHFLFNSINSIYGHIDKRNAIARNLLLTFSEMLRYQLYECNVEQIPIEKEIQYIRNYVALQQIRKEEDLVVQLEIGPEVRGCSIAPLLFMAFIENAFKYVSNLEEGSNRVAVLLHRQGETLHFRTFNTKDREPGQPIRHSGIGIANVRRRLELLYPGKHTLTISGDPQSYQVDLQLELT